MNCTFNQFVAMTGENGSLPQLWKSKLSSRCQCMWWSADDGMIIIPTSDSNVMHRGQTVVKMGSTSIHNENVV